MPIAEGKHYIYTVQPGDTLYNIAARLGSAVQLIEQTNSLYPPFSEPGLIYIGQVLVVSEAGLEQEREVDYIIAPGDTLYEIARRFAVGPELIAAFNAISDPSFILANQPIRVPAFIYEVDTGDTLNSIAQRFGITLQQLLAANENRPALSPDVVYPGYRLIIPLPSSRNIVITRPFPGKRITQGQTMEGYARAVGGVVYYQIRDAQNRVVTSEKTVYTLAGAPAFSPFSTVLRFDNEPETAEGEVWVYTRSPRDGSISNLTQLKVAF